MKLIIVCVFLCFCRLGFAQSPDSLLVGGASTVHSIRDHREGMSFRLTGIYSRDEVLYYRVEAFNNSPLVYDVDGLRCAIRDQKVVRRHAIQEVTMVPLWVKGDSLRVGPGRRAIWLVALRKEVLPPGQYLSIGLLERHGGRNLELKVGYRRLLEAAILD